MSLCFDAIFQILLQFQYPNSILVRSLKYFNIKIAGLYILHKPVNLSSFSNAVCGLKEKENVKLIFNANAQTLLFFYTFKITDDNGRVNTYFGNKIFKILITPQFKSKNTLICLITTIQNY